jgi:hypothetical protein
MTSSIRRRRHMRKKTNDIPFRNRFLNIRLDSILDAELRQMGKRHDMSASALARRGIVMLLTHLKQHNTLWIAPEAAGVRG